MFGHSKITFSTSRLFSLPLYHSIIDGWTLAIATAFINRSLTLGKRVGSRTSIWWLEVDLLLADDLGWGMREMVVALPALQSVRFPASWEAPPTPRRRRISHSFPTEGRRARLH